MQSLNWIFFIPKIYCYTDKLPPTFRKGNYCVVRYEIDATRTQVLLVNYRYLIVMLHVGSTQMQLGGNLTAE